MLVLFLVDRNIFRTKLGSTQVRFFRDSKMPFSKRKEKMKGAAEEKGHKEKRKGEGRERSLLEIPGSGHAATQRRKDENNNKKRRKKGSLSTCSCIVYL